MLAAVDFDLRFTYVLVGWERSAHDALILADALERDDGLRVSQNLLRNRAHMHPSMSQQTSDSVHEFPTT